MKSVKLYGARYVACKGKINACKILVREPEGKKNAWEGNIIMDLREVGFEVWTECVWLRILSNDGLL
jgi:hypothetical protein